MDNAFDFIIKIGGLTSEELYPYVSGNGTTGTCKTKLEVKKVAKISDYCDVIPKNETALELALNQQVTNPCLPASRLQTSRRNGLTHSRFCLALSMPP